jgi:hypothetical protein
MSSDPAFPKAATLVALIFALVAGAATAQTYITPATPGWSFATETPTGSGAFVVGPAGAPSGSPGSLQLTVGNPGGELFYTQQYAGLRLDQMAGLRYSTFVVSSAIPETANLQFDFDNDLTSPTATYGGRAVFSPQLIAGAVQVGAWQTWNPLAQRAWWGSGTPGTRPLNQVCTQAAPCTFAEMLAAFPNGGVLADLGAGAFGFKVGNSSSAAVVSVDGFTLGTGGLAGPVTQFKFAPFAPPPLVPVPAVAPGMLALLAAMLGWLAMLALGRRQR